MGQTGINIHLTIGGDAPVTSPAPSHDGMVFGWVLPDYEMTWVEEDKNGALQTLKHLDRNSRNEILACKKQGTGYDAPSGHAVPATARFSDDTPVSMPCDLQWWMFDMNKNKAASLERAKADWAACFRDNAWMSNKTGTWTRHDCINENLMPDFLQAQPMMTGGCLFRQVGETSSDRLVEAINPMVNNYKLFNPKNHPWLFFTPKLSARVKLVDAKGYTTGFECWYEEPMHFFGECMDVPVFGFIRDSRATLTGYVNKLPKSRTRLLARGEAVPNPYIMRDGRILANPYEGFIA